MKYWQPGEHCVYRGIIHQRVWTAMPVTVVQDAPDQTVLLLQPGARCAVPECVYLRHNAREHYVHGTRWQDAQAEFLNHTWETWHTNRTIMFLEPEKYYACMLFWRHATDEFIGYYINFQLPFQRTRLGFDSLDLDLDIVIDPSHEWHWKDEEDYRQAVENGGILPEWAQGIERDTPEVFDRIQRRLAPLYETWIHWQPDPAWTQPVLPDGWQVL